MELLTALALLNRIDSHSKSRYILQDKASIILDNLVVAVDGIHAVLDRLRQFADIMSSVSSDPWQGDSQVIHLERNLYERLQTFYPRQYTCNFLFDKLP